MHFLLRVIAAIVLIFVPLNSTDVCIDTVCTCDESVATVNCDGKGWANLSAFTFPISAVTLTLVNNKLKFDSIDDRQKLESLPNLKNLILNGNPLGVIPPFTLKTVQSLSLQETSLVSAAFPSTYINATLLHTISLSKNKIRTIKENDFSALRDLTVKKLSLDDASLTTIDPNAFIPLKQLQSLSLQTNQLKSCEFLSTCPRLSSIKLDGNQFISLPPQLTTPNKIKTYSFTQNHITIISDSSPLYIWQKMNFTNMKIYLANNSFDCCQSQWFIHFVTTSANLVGDASLLTCTKPAELAGKQLIKLRPDEMYCGGVTRAKPWLMISLASVGGTIAVIILAFIFIVILRRKRTQSSYTEIDGIDDVLPTAPPLSAADPVFPEYGDDDDRYSEHQTVISTRTVSGSEAPTL